MKKLFRGKAVIIMLAVVLAGIFSGSRALAAPETEKTSYVKDTFFSQSTMQGIYASSELYFYIPEYWDTKYVYAGLEYRVSQLIQEVSSSMTFYVNQVPVSSQVVTYGGGDTQISYVEIPVELLNEGYNSFRISAYARLFDEEGCTDDYSDANWLSLSDTSYIRCGYEVKDHRNMISYYPYPFLSTIDETGKGLYLAVSDSASNEEVAAAMQLMTDLSSRTVLENQIHLALWSDVKSSNAKGTILISEYDHLSSDLKKQVSNADSIEDQGVVVFTEDEKGNPLLLITAKEKKSLMEAVFMLMDEERVSQERGSTAVVQADSSQLIAQEESKASDAGNYLLSDFVEGGLNFIGPFHQEQLLYLPFSGSYSLSEAGKMTLYFRYSENLDFNRSMITVYWGDVPLASKKLNKAKAGGDELTLTIPADAAGTPAGAIKIAFELELPDMFCTPRQEQMPWAYVSEDSAFYLPLSEVSDLSFDVLPSPFLAEGKWNDVLLLLSDAPDTEELDLYGQIVGMYSEGAAPYGSLKVKRVGEFTQEDADYPIIVAGTYQNNSFLRSLNEQLHFSYGESGQSFESNEQLILSEDYSENISILQLVKSPYAEDKAILALTGTTRKTLDHAEKFMRVVGNRYELEKDCVIIDEELSLRTFQFQVSSLEMTDLTFAETLSHNKQSILFTIVATSVMLMLLVAVIIILLRIKMYHRKREDK